MANFRFAHYSSLFLTIPGKEKSSDFFTKGLGFYILLGVSVLFLIVIVILAFKMNRDRKLANWEHQHKNGRVCYRAERMEPFLLDGESGETVSDQVQLGSFGSTDEKMQLTAPNHL